MQALVDRLHELGYSEGKNMTFEYRSAEGRPERLSQLALDTRASQARRADCGIGDPAAQAAKAATTTIPIVFALVGDPVGAGLVAASASPAAMSQDSAAR